MIERRAVAFMVFSFISAGVALSDNARPASSGSSCSSAEQDPSMYLSAEDWISWEQVFHGLETKKIKTGVDDDPSR